MGKITVVGKAERTVQCDVMEINLKFNVTESNAASAVKAMLKQGEKFLQAVEALGIKAEAIELGDNNVEQNSYRDENNVSASRKLIIRTAFDMQLLNNIMTIIYNGKYDVEVTTNYLLTTKDELHKELMQEALLDSKAKAKKLVAALGQKVVGIVSADLRESYYDEPLLFERERTVGVLHEGSSYEYSDKLSSPTTTEREKIEVVWEIK